MMLHPGAKIILWLAFAICLQRWQMNQLGMATLVLSIWLLPTKWSMLSKLIRRTSILMVSLFLVYGFTVPGDMLLPFLGSWSPSVQGMADGLIQAWKLMLMLASLAWILGTTGREQFLYGIYWLSYPTRYIGVNPERIAARIGLTLEYAVQTPIRDVSWFKRLKDGVFQEEMSYQHEVVLTTMPFRWQDGLILLLGIVLLVWVT